MKGITIFHFTPGGKMNQTVSLDEAFDVLSAGGFLWVNCFNPERKDFEPVAEKLGLHPLAVEDCFNEEQVPKIEDYPDSVFFIFNSFHYSSGILNLLEVDFFLGRNFLVTVSGYGSSLPGSLADIVRVVEQNIDSAKTGASFLFYVILDYLVDSKFVAVEAMEDALDVTENQIVAESDEFRPADLVKIRQQLLNLRKSLFHEREILIKICRKDSPFIEEKSIYHFRDIYDHISKFFELTESYREVVTSQMELYMSMQNNKMARNSIETNAFIKRLTLLTTIFMPLTLLAGIGGMSEWSMMTGPGNWKISYPLFMLGMVIIGLLNYLLLMRVERTWNKKKKGSSLE